MIYIKKLTKLSLVICLLILSASVLHASSSDNKEMSATGNNLFSRLSIMNSWFYKTDLNTAQQAELLKRIGVPRICISLGNSKERLDAFPQNLKTLDDAGVEIAAIYIGANIDSPVIVDNVIRVINLLKGRDTLVWFTLSSKKHSPSAAEGDAMAVKLLAQAADITEKNNLEISLYPHFGSWLERTSDALRIISKLKRDNVGCTVNLYHWLKVEGPDNLDELAKAAAPHLNCVTINGSRNNAKELKVEEGILPLGEGDTNVEAFVKTFIESGYKGPFPIQGYGIGGDVEAKLKQSVEQWRGYCTRIK